MGIKYDIKTFPKDTDFSAQMDMYKNDLLSEIHRMISGKVSENYDELAFSLLGQFGINKDNWREHVGRVVIVDTACDPWTKHFYIDGEYRFSIVEQPGELIFDDEKREYGMRIGYKVEVFEDML